MFSTVLPLIFAGSVLAGTLPHGWQPWSAETPARAIYVMTNEVSGNEVVAMGIDSDGGLSGGFHFATGGIGGNYLSPVDGHPLFPDSLGSQDAVVQADNYLFVVNAGSNTVSMFFISPSDPTSLTLLGSPESSKGDFPTSLAASTALKCVCVGNSGANSGISCSSFSASGLAGFDSLRALDVGQTTTPPLGPIPGVGDILFSENNDKLIAMIKGNGTQFTGYAATFSIAPDGTVGQTPSAGTPLASKVLFGTSTIPGLPNTVFASDAGFGALVLNLDDLSAPPLAVTNVTGQAASCWAEVSSTGRGFITDVARNRLVEVNLADGAIVAEFYPPTPFGGMSDFRIRGDYLWALSASNGSHPTSITTFDIGGGVGSIEFASVYAVPGAGHNTQGLAIW